MYSDAGVVVPLGLSGARGGGGGGSGGLSRADVEALVDSRLAAVLQSTVDKAVAAAVATLRELPLPAHFVAAAQPQLAALVEACAVPQARATAEATVSAAVGDVTARLEVAEGITRELAAAVGDLSTRPRRPTAPPASGIAEGDLRTEIALLSDSLRREIATSTAIGRTLAARVDGFNTLLNEQAAAVVDTRTFAATQVQEVLQTLRRHAAAVRDNLDAQGTLVKAVVSQSTEALEKRIADQEAVLASLHSTVAADSAEVQALRQRVDEAQQTANRQYTSQQSTLAALEAIVGEVSSLLGTYETRTLIATEERCTAMLSAAPWRADTAALSHSVVDLQHHLAGVRADVQSSIAAGHSLHERLAAAMEAMRADVNDRVGAAAEAAAKRCDEVDRGIAALTDSVSAQLAEHRAGASSVHATMESLAGVITSLRLSIPSARQADLDALHDSLAQMQSQLRFATSQLTAHSLTIADSTAAMDTLKGDLASSVESVRADVAAARGEMSSSVESVRADVESVRADVESVRADVSAAVAQSSAHHSEAQHDTLARLDRVDNTVSSLLSALEALSFDHASLGTSVSTVRALTDATALSVKSLDARVAGLLEDHDSGSGIGSGVASASLEATVTAEVLSLKHHVGQQLGAVDADVHAVRTELRERTDELQSAMRRLRDDLATAHVQLSTSAQESAVAAREALHAQLTSLSQRVNRLSEELATEATVAAVAAVQPLVETAACLRSWPQQVSDEVERRVPSVVNAMLERALAERLAGALSNAAQEALPPMLTRMLPSFVASHLRELVRDEVSGSGLDPRIREALTQLLPGLLPDLLPTALQAFASRAGIGRAAGGDASSPSMPPAASTLQRLVRGSAYRLMTPGQVDAQPVTASSSPDGATPQRPGDMTSTLNAAASPTSAHRDGRRFSEFTLTSPTPTTTLNANSLPADAVPAPADAASALLLSPAPAPRLAGSSASTTPRPGSSDHLSATNTPTTSGGAMTAANAVISQAVPASAITAALSTPPPPAAAAAAASRMVAPPSHVHGHSASSSASDAALDEVHALLARHRSMRAGTGSAVNATPPAPPSTGRGALLATTASTRELLASAIPTSSGREAGLGRTPPPFVAVRSPSDSPASPATTEQPFAARGSTYLSSPSVPSLPTSGVLSPSVRDSLSYSARDRALLPVADGSSSPVRTLTSIPSRSALTLSSPRQPSAGSTLAPASSLSAGMLRSLLTGSDSAGVAVATGTAAPHQLTPVPPAAPAATADGSSAAGGAVSWRGVPLRSLSTHAMPVSPPSHTGADASAGSGGVAPLPDHTGTSSRASAPPRSRHPSLPGHSEEGEGDGDEEGEGEEGLTTLAPDASNLDALVGR